MMKYKLMVFDIDGVFTDGGMYYGNAPAPWRCFCSMDGVAIRLLQQTPITPVIITGRKSAAVTNRMADLGVKYVYQGIRNKLATLYSILPSFEADLKQVIYLGDDLNDYPALEQVGFPMCIVHSPDELKRIARYVTRRDGGHGAVREAVEYILREQGMYHQAVRDFVDHLKQA